MTDLPFPMTQNLITALAEIAGIEPDPSDPVVVLAAYVDALAKEYGLSESLAIDVDPCERTQQVEPVMEIVNHYLTGAGTSGTSVPDADMARARLYDAVTILAGDATARKALNRSRPLTDVGVMYLAQVYWNLEAGQARARLPIKPGDGRDIPVPGLLDADFSTMLWTDRVTQKGSYKSSGNSFRTQGARLAVLIAKHLAAQTSPAPAPSTELHVRPTSDVNQPLEITLQNLVTQAVVDGAHDDAYALSISYLDIIKRRAEINPFDLEADLAEAYMVRGFLANQIGTATATGTVAVVTDSVDDLEKAAASFQTLCALHPDNPDYQSSYQTTQSVLAMAYQEAGRLDDAITLTTQLVALADEWAAQDLADPGRRVRVYATLQFLHRQLTAGERHGEAVAVARRKVQVAEQFLSAPPGQEQKWLGLSFTDIEPRERALLDSVQDLALQLREVGLPIEAAEAARRAIAFCDASTYLSLSAEPSRRSMLHVLLAMALKDSGDDLDATEAVRRAVAIGDSYDVPAGVRACGLVLLGDLLNSIDETAEAWATYHRAIPLAAEARTAEPDKASYLSFLDGALIGLINTGATLDRIKETADIVSKYVDDE